jgi:DNA-binding protein Fis
MEFVDTTPIIIDDPLPLTAHALSESSDCQETIIQYDNGLPRMSHAGPLPSTDRLVRQMELRLENVVEKLLLSKAGENDNLLASVHEIMEKMFLRSALRIAEGNISRAAKLLGINRNTLSKKLRVLEAKS